MEVPFYLFMYCSFLNSLSWACAPPSPILNVCCLLVRKMITGVIGEPSEESMTKLNQNLLSRLTRGIMLSAASSPFVSNFLALCSAPVEKGLTRSRRGLERTDHHLGSLRNILYLASKMKCPGFTAAFTLFVFFFQLATQHPHRRHTVKEIALLSAGLSILAHSLWQSSAPPPFPPNPFSGKSNFGHQWKEKEAKVCVCVCGHDCLTDLDIEQVLW